MVEVSDFETTDVAKNYGHIFVNNVSCCKDMEPYRSINFTLLEILKSALDGDSEFRFFFHFSAILL